MKFVTEFIALLLILVLPASINADSFSKILKKAALDNGFLPPHQLYDDRDSNLSKLGKVFFESENISLNRKISCKACHLNEFGSADGIPIAVGIGGKGQGNERALGEGKFIPRNTLPLWGRGGNGFNTYFWDGKVDFSNGSKISQFGNDAPSSDSLVVAIHLPAIEIGEMLVDDSMVKQHKKETTKDALMVYKLMAEKVREHEKGAVHELAKAVGKKSAEIQFIDIARSMASFIRSEFRIKNTKFHKFLFDNGDLTDEELRGGLIFYGKGKCSICHKGPYLTDFEFHSIPFPQLGFGKNGFGIDYGRFNVTFEPKDLYKFRTPPLFNAAKTSPYGHSGSAATLSEAITYHFDPLKSSKIEEMNKLERHEYYKRLAISSQSILYISYLTDDEVKLLVKFLETLSFD